MRLDFFYRGEQLYWVEEARILSLRSNNALFGCPKHGAVSAISAEQPLVPQAQDLSCFGW